MIYNLVKYLNTNLPAYTFVANGSEPENEDELISVIDNGGDDSHYIDRQDVAIQFMVRALSKPAAYAMAAAAYAEIKNRFGLLLPVETVDAIVYPAVQTYRIVPVQRPGYIGSDEMGRFLFSFNVTITI